MNDKRGKPICPECGFHLIARSGDMLFCLSNECKWHIVSKRKDDLETIQEIHNLKKLWE